MITFGSDPEFMIADKQGNLKSAIGIVPGTKTDRHTILGGHEVYYDNVLAECSIKPASSPDEAISNFRQCFGGYAQIVAPYKLLVRASAEYPKVECEHDDAKLFGCDPEFCAYRVCIIEPPECAGLFRSGGGHVHIGYDGGADLPFNDENEEANCQIAFNRIKVIKMCDLFIGIPSLFLDRDPTSKKRRKLYGGAGSHRVCPSYGAEYRCVSNFWVAKPKLVELMYHLADFSAEVVCQNRFDEIWDKVQGDRLPEIINEWKSAKAKPILEEVLGLLPKPTKTKLQSLLDEPNEKADYGSDFYEQWGIKLA